MSNANKPKPSGIAASNTRHLFGARKAGDRAPITHESLETDLAAFRQAGGKIEVLGNTQSLQRIGREVDAEAAATATPPKRRR